jgi:hypothetical protein
MDVHVELVEAGHRLAAAVEAWNQRRTTNNEERMVNELHAYRTVKLRLRLREGPKVPTGFAACHGLPLQR